MVNDQRMTWSWLRKYANQYRPASYQDKRNALYREKNPYYLLEWLVLPMPEYVKEELRYSRSPGMIKNSYVDFIDVFFGQLLYEICFAPDNPEPSNIMSMKSAIQDLRTLYGEELWNHGVAHAILLLQEALSKHKQFLQQLGQEEARIKQEYEKQLQEIKELFAEEEAERVHRLQMARDSYQKKSEEAPKKLLQKKYADCPLLTFFHYKSWKQPSSRVENFIRQLEDADRIPYEKHISQADCSAVSKTLASNESERKQFIAWFISYASKTEMNRGYIETQSRQTWWIGLLEKETSDRRSGECETAAADYLQAVFELNGIEEVMMKPEGIPPFFHALVAAALQEEDRTKWIREIIILRCWERFMESFAQKEYSFAALSWVLCLDPENLQQRLLRRNHVHPDGYSINIDPEFVVERCCDIFSDGIRAGWTSRVMLPIFHYLAIHDRHTLVQYVYKVKRFAELLPILQMEKSVLDRLFGGDTPSAKAIRKQLFAIVLDGLRSALTDEEKLELIKAGNLLQPDKDERIIEWLEARKARKAGEEGWPCAEAEQVARLLEVDWVGSEINFRDQHQWVEDCLAAHSEWIKFDMDTPLAGNSSVTYKIIRPGCRDRVNGRILARIVVRAELKDVDVISSLLDDLKNL